jgi:sec-independent protein translocase protein TatC
MFILKSKNSSTAPQHFAELRLRILWIIAFFAFSFCISYYFANQIYAFLLQPFLSISTTARKLIFTAPSEVFFSYIKLSFYSAIFVSIPVAFLQLYLFLLPALYLQEKKIAVLLLLISPLLFFLGAIFSYYFAIPLALKFFTSYETNFFSTQSSGAEINLILEAKISNYLDFIIDILIGFGLAFLTPVMLLLLIKTKIIDISSIKNKRRYVIVAIFIIAAILTPPDIFSQLILAIIMILLFEISLLFAKFL